MTTPEEGEHIPGPLLLPVGTVDPSTPGAPWWMYQRPEVPVVERTAAAAAPGYKEPSGPVADHDGAEAPDDGPDVNAEGPRELISTRAPSPGPMVVLGLLALGAMATATRLEIQGLGTVLVSVAGLCFVAAFSRRAKRVHPDEPWLGKWMAYGLIAKLITSYLRFVTLVVGYDGVGDATGYDGFGQQFARAWSTGGTPPELEDLRQTNFLRWFTGVIYYLFGTNMLTGFLVFALIAFVGSYLWYRATVDALPFVDKRLYLKLMLFVPSIVFWPASIGKESLMQLGIGVMALGTSLLLRQALVKGLSIALFGGWMLWLVRPHLLALVAMGGGMAYLLGRVRRPDGSGSLLSRPVGLIAVAFLVVFTVTEGAEFLGIEDLSLNSIEAELDEQTDRSAQGGSQFETGGNSLNPLKLPQGAVTVLLRPFPWETDTPLQLLASLESAILAVFIFRRLPSLRVALSRSRVHPYLLYCWTLTALYAAAFSSFANFGLLTRQRSLVLPALFVLLAVDPLLARRHQARTEPDPDDDERPDVPEVIHGRP